MYEDDNCLEWLNNHTQLERHNNASFVECMRWMRIPKKIIEDTRGLTREQVTLNGVNKQYNIDSQLKLLQIATENANNFTDKNKEYLEILNKRIKNIAGEENTFNAECLWRTRVGGHRGAENILLPAFDHLGIPFIPSSTLRGIARNQALLELGSDLEVSKYFGSLEVDSSNKMGKVIFLDAYPTAGKWRKNNISLDIANNIWEWSGNNIIYKPNPNTFISLSKAGFLIGLKPTNKCEPAHLEKVKSWLKQGLLAGVGSQINSGYGEIKIKGESETNEPFLEVGFTLQSQFIHGNQRFNDLREPYKKVRGEIKRSRDKIPQTNTSSQPEVRPIAFKSMLRYWFRTITLGFISVEDVKQFESHLFGSIEPQNRGWVKFRVSGGNKVIPNQEDRPCGIQRGKLKLYYSSEIKSSNKEIVRQLFIDLSWLMFHLGGIGQGSRRPLYKRRNNPYYRGSKLRFTSNTLETSPTSYKEFASLFREKLNSFLENLMVLTGKQVELSSNINDHIEEAFNSKCEIFVYSGKYDLQKNNALEILHDDKEYHSINDRGKKIYNSELCGGNGNPSPVWIAGLDNYQVITIFGSNTGLRKDFAGKLKNNKDKCLQVFPVKNSQL